MWIALKAQTIRRAGKYVTVNAGDGIPEAEKWADRKMWEAHKFIKEIPGDVVPMPKAAITGIVEQAPQVEVEKPRRGRPPKNRNVVVVDLDELA